jgi:hypothetical protein
MNALVAVFGDAFSSVLAPEPLVDIHYGIEYPVQKGEYPYCQIGFEESSIANSTVSDSVVLNGDRLPYRHWTFGGSARFSFFSLSAAERDIMIDGFIEVVAMDRVLMSRLRDESINPYIAIELSLEDVMPTGSADSPGTPWGTDEVVYYSSFDIDVQGEFWTTPPEAEDVGMVEIIKVYAVNEDAADDTEQPNQDEGQWV